MAISRVSAEKKGAAVMTALRSSEPMSVTARRLGLLPQTLHRWIKEYQRDGVAAWRPRVPRARAKFDALFRERAVEKVKRRQKTLTEIAGELGISVAVLSKWVRVIEEKGNGAWPRERAVRNRKFTQEQRDKLARRALDDKRPLKEVAETMGVAPQVLRIWMTSLRKGPQLRRKKQWFSPEFKLDAARRAVAEGVIVAAVARDLGVLPAVLYDWVKAYKEKGDRFVVKRPVIPRQFDDAFRKRAVMLAQDPKNVPARVARQLGISKALLSQWLSAER